jgi:alkanesulfonate monooxygenase SsuD/methylene tetrahydromethanopterin reductase-like flavin-dependent oxidoreductase (luciferase family)
MTLGFGVTSTIDLELVQRIAPSVEDAGFTFFWSNDIPGGSSFDVLAAVAGVTDSLNLANGVVPIDRVPPESWGDRIERAGLVGDRFWPGIGSGRIERPLEPMSDAIQTIRQLTGRPVVIGALRTRMRRLAAETADGVLLNWLTPQAAAERRDEMNALRHDAGVARSFMTAAFVRVAIGDVAIGRLRTEADRYESFPAYGKHFAEMGVGAFATTVAASTVEEAAAMLVPFLASLDHAVLRCVIGQEDDEAYLELVETGRLAIDRAASV